MEAHPDNELPDLRLDSPFDELTNYCNSIDLEALPDAEHSHIPYLVLLYKYLMLWRSSHGGEIPRVFKEKLAFKELVRSGIRRNEELVPKFEENFDEAINNVESLIFDYVSIYNSQANLIGNSNKNLEESLKLQPIV